MTKQNKKDTLTLVDDDEYYYDNDNHDDDKNEKKKNCGSDRELNWKLKAHSVNETHRLTKIHTIEMFHLFSWHRHVLVAFLRFCRL